MGPTVKHEWDIVMYCIIILAYQKQNSLPLGPIQSLSPFTKELQDRTDEDTS